ncbi:uncharacterized protein [Branchiostoma lanceolatum]|uniref:uncharacterized protein n=1 Tax=Branchiostoma lanceolatum TaxID=7740 RepID=UPI0034552A30
MAFTLVLCVGFFLHVCSAQPQPQLPSTPCNASLLEWGHAECAIDPDCIYRLTPPRIDLENPPTNYKLLAADRELKKLQRLISQFKVTLIQSGVLDFQLFPLIKSTEISVKVARKSLSEAIGGNRKLEYTSDRTAKAVEETAEIEFQEMQGMVEDLLIWCNVCPKDEDKDRVDDELGTLIYAEPSQWVSSVLDSLL